MLCFAALLIFIGSKSPYIGNTVRGKNGLHAFGNKTDKSETIWMKFRTLWAKRWGRPKQILNAIRSVATVWEAAEVLFFCPVNNARFYRFSVGQILRHLNTTKTIPLKLSLLRESRPKSARTSPHTWLTLFQISSKSFHFRRSFRRTR